MREAVSVGFRHCALADTDALIAADPCDAWVLRFETDYAAHLLVNHAAANYVYSIRSKHESKAANDYNRCLGLPVPPEPQPDAVHLSLSAKGVSGGAGNSGGEPGLKDARIVNFGPDPATGGGSCSSIPRTVFCEPVLHVKINPLSKIKEGVSGSSVVTYPSFYPSSGATVRADEPIVALASLALSYDGAWLEFDGMAAGMHYGNELVAEERIATDGFTLKVPLNVGGYPIWPGVDLHVALEARRREDGAVKTLDTEILSAQSMTRDDGGYGDLVFAAANRAYAFGPADSGTWDFYAVPLMLQLADPLEYYFVDGGDNRLCQNKSFVTAGMATYTPGMAGGVKYATRTIIHPHGFEARLVGVGVATQWWQGSPNLSVLASATFAAINPLESELVAHLFAPGGWYACRMPPMGGENTRRRTIPLGFAGEDRLQVVYLQEAAYCDSHQNDTFIEQANWNHQTYPAPPVFAAYADASEVSVAFPDVLGERYETVNLTTDYGGTTVLNRFQFPAAGAMQVYFYTSSAKINHTSISISAGVVLSAVYDMDAEIIEFAAADAGASYYDYPSNYSPSGRRYDSFLHLSGRPECLSVLNDYITANWGAHGGVFEGQYHVLALGSAASADLVNSGQKIKIKAPG